MAVNKVVYGGKTLIDLTGDTASSEKMLSGTKAHTRTGGITIGSISSQIAQIITPGTEDQTIAAGNYLSGDQTIKGDANLVAENIKSGVSIFGVEGTLKTPSASFKLTNNTGQNILIGGMRMLDGESLSMPSDTFAYFSWNFFNFVVATFSASFSSCPVTVNGSTIETILTQNTTKFPFVFTLQLVTQSVFGNGDEIVLGTLS